MEGIDMTLIEILSYQTKLRRCGFVWMVKKNLDI